MFNEEDNTFWQDRSRRTKKMTLEYKCGRQSGRGPFLELQLGKKTLLNIRPFLTEDKTIFFGINSRRASRLLSRYNPSYFTISNFSVSQRFKLAMNYSTQNGAALASKQGQGSYPTARWVR